MSTRTTLIAAALCLGAAAAVSAQNAPSPVKTGPKYLMIVDENVKAGKGAAHEKNEAGWAAEYSKADNKAYYFAMNPMTGGTSTLYISGYNSWAEVSAAQDAVAKVPGLQEKIAAYADKENDFLNGVRVTWAAFQPAITIGDVPDFAKVHGYRITTYRVRIGHTDEFVEARKMLKAGYEKAGVTTAHFGVFVVTQGVTVPTYLVFRPFTSLAEFDSDSATNATVMAQVPADSMKKYDKLIEASLVARETDTYTISPKTSYVPAAFADADPFWKNSPTVVAANTKKSAVTQAGATRSAKKKQ
jgi:hypothetical protein